MESSSPHFYPAIAKIIRKIRTDAGFTQARLAESAKESASYIYRLEAGKRGVSLANLMDIATAVGINTWEVVKMIEEEMLQMEVDSWMKNRPSSLDDDE